MSEKLENFIKSLSSVEKDELYRRLWFEHVRTDVIQFCEENHAAYNDDSFVDDVAMSYVCGKYDCNLSYWDNISNLVNSMTEQKSTTGYDVWETKNQETRYLGEFDLLGLKTFIMGLPTSNAELTSFYQTFLSSKADLSNKNKKQTLRVRGDYWSVDIAVAKPFDSIEQFMSLIFDMYHYNSWSDEMIRSIISEAAGFDNRKEAFAFLDRMLPSEIQRNYVERLPFLN